ncbi:hypothetical protein [Frankia sp. CcWB3]
MMLSITYLLLHYVPLEHRIDYTTGPAAPRSGRTSAPRRPRTPRTPPPHW